MSKIVDLGAGKNPARPDAITVDRPVNDPDIVHDLEKTPYPFDDGEITAVYMRHVLEHLHNWKDAIREIDRILRPGGRAHIVVPHFSSSIRYPDHNNHFSYRSLVELFDPESSMFLDTDLTLGNRKMVWAGAAPTKNKLSPVMDRVVNSRLAPYMDTYFWAFIGNIDGLHFRLDKKRG